MNRLLLIILLNSFLGISQTNNESIFYNGVELYNQGEYQKAISQFELIIENGEHSDALYFNLANSYYKINDLANSIYYFEKDLQPEEFGSVPQALWWSVVTLTSVGYGDVTPNSTGGKVFTSIILFLGIGLVSVPSAILVSAFSKASKK